MSEENAVMNFEFLPNEIFLDLFDYFTGRALLRAFYGLNTRFNVLLYKEFRSYRFRFECVSKRHFDQICQQHLPFITHQVITLHLSEHRETPESISLFLSYIPSLRQFTHLHSIALAHLHSYELLLKLLDECQHLSHLTDFKLNSCSLSNSSADYQLILNKIWSLPKLIRCYFAIDIIGDQDFDIPTTISTSLERLTLIHDELQWNQLHRLLECTPRWKSLSTYIAESDNDDYIAHLYPTLIRLSIRFYADIHLPKMVVLLQNIPHLRHLNITMPCQLLNGYNWKHIIRNHLPKLKTLRLKMNGSFYYGENIQENANNLLDSFRSTFWIDQHQWFVRCMTWERRIQLEILSSASHCLKSEIPDSWQSTYPNDNQQKMYQNITTLYSSFFDQSISSNIRLPRIRYLHVKLPINDQFWSIVPNLNKLNSLTVLSYSDTYQSQLQTLLNRAPHLHTLDIRQNLFLSLQTSLFTYTNISVRRLYFEECRHDFDEEECLKLTASSLGVQCQVLSIRVTTRQSIIHLVQKLLNLRALSVKCADDKYRKRAGLREDNDELVQWLKCHLSLLYMIVRDVRKDSSHILIWM